MNQRDMMRQLISQYGRNLDVVCREYAKAEQRGDVERKRNMYGMTPEEYARALWNDGEKKGWF